MASASSSRSRLLPLLLLSSLWPALILSQSSNELWETERPSDMARISSLEVMCGKQHMEVSLSFDRPFNGLVFSKGAVDRYECIYVKPQSDSQEFQFNIYYDRCATKPDLNGRFYENNIVVQYDRDLIEVWDEAKRLRCEWYNDYERGVTKPPIRVADLDVIELNFRGDNVDCWMEIQQGKGPWASPVQGIVPLGTTLTMVVGIDDKQGEFDMRVKSCEATDNRNRPIALTDGDGCVLRPKMISSFMKMKSADVSRATVVTYAFFHAFKFPDTMAVQIRCKVEICRYGCPEHCQRASANPSYQRELSVHSAQQNVAGSSLKREIENNEAIDNDDDDNELIDDIELNNDIKLNKPNIQKENKEEMKVVPELGLNIRNRPKVRQQKPRKTPPRRPNGGKRRLRPASRPQRRPGGRQRPGVRQRGQPQPGRPRRRPVPQGRRKRTNIGTRRMEEEEEMNNFAKRRLNVANNRRNEDENESKSKGGFLSNLGDLLPKPRLPTLQLPSFRLPSLFGTAEKKKKVVQPTERRVTPVSVPKELPSAVPVSRTRSKSAQPLVFRASSSSAALSARPIEAAPLHEGAFPYGPRSLDLENIDAALDQTILDDALINDEKIVNKGSRRRRSAESDVGVQSTYEVVSQVDLAFDPDQQAEVAVLKGRMSDEDDVVYGVCLPVTSFSLLFVLVSLLTVVSVLVSGFVCYQRQLTKADKEAAPSIAPAIRPGTNNNSNSLVYAAWFNRRGNSNNVVY